MDGHTAVRDFAMLWEFGNKQQNLENYVYHLIHPFYS